MATSECCGQAPRPSSTAPTEWASCNRESRSRPPRFPASSSDVIQVRHRIRPALPSAHPPDHSALLHPTHPRATEPALSWQLSCQAARTGTTRSRAPAPPSASRHRCCRRTSSRSAGCFSPKSTRPTATAARRPNPTSTKRSRRSASVQHASSATRTDRRPPAWPGRRRRLPPLDPPRQHWRALPRASCTTCAKRWVPLHAARLHGSSSALRARVLADAARTYARAQARGLQGSPSGLDSTLSSHGRQSPSSTLGHSRTHALSSTAHSPSHALGSTSASAPALASTMAPTAVDEAAMVRPLIHGLRRCAAVSHRTGASAQRRAA